MPHGAWWDCSLILCSTTNSCWSTTAWGTTAPAAQTFRQRKATATTTASCCCRSWQARISSGLPWGNRRGGPERWDPRFRYCWSTWGNIMLSINITKHLVSKYHSFYFCCWNTACNICCTVISGYPQVQGEFFKKSTKLGYISQQGVGSVGCNP